MRLKGTDSSSSNSPTTNLSELVSTGLHSQRLWVILIRHRAPMDIDTNFSVNTCTAHHPATCTLHFGSLHDDGIGFPNNFTFSFVFLAPFLCDVYIRGMEYSWSTSLPLFLQFPANHGFRQRSREACGMLFFHSGPWDLLNFYS
jgi:hypothetical protein